MPNLINLKKIRKARGLTQNELADKVNVTESFISQCETGKKSPSLEVALRIAEALDCETADLVTKRMGLLNLIEDKKITATIDGDGELFDIIKLSDLNEDQRLAIHAVVTSNATVLHHARPAIELLLSQQQDQDDPK